METVNVSWGTRGYTISIEAGILDEIGSAVATFAPSKKALIVTDENVGALYAKRAVASLQAHGIKTSVCTLKAGEQNKTIESWSQILDACVDASLDRKSALVALGGGVVGDITGFAAATYMRGVPYIQVPTTMLAQSDSSVGGKTAVDHPKGKNLIGAFHQPSAVIIDTQTLNTLPKREVLAGLAEVLKHGIIRDAEFLDKLEKNCDAILALDPKLIASVVRKNCEIKASVVMEDEKETTGIRAILNYGHTVGHALEAVKNYSELLHGEAVFKGMMIAAKLSEKLGRCSKDVWEHQRRVFNLFGVDWSMPKDIDIEKVIELLFGDKKTEGGELNFVLPNRIGECVLVKNISVDDVRSVLLDGE